MPFPKRLTLDNATDLYFGSPIATHTWEHVLQDSLGGVFEVVGLIDRTTNNKLGGTLDKSLTDSFGWVRAMIGLPNARREPIRVESSAGGYDILGDAPVRKKANNGPPWVVETGPDGTRRVKIVAADMEQAKEIANHALGALKVGPEMVTDVRLAQVREFPPAIPIQVRVGGPLDLRAVAKSCGNALAVCRSPAAVLHTRFDAIRAYVRYGVDHHNTLLSGEADPQPAYACWDSRPELFAELPAACALGPVDHRLVIRGCGDQHTVYATVELFGHLPVSVLLTDDWRGPDFCWGMVTDPRPHGNGHWRGELSPGARPALLAADVMAHATDGGGLKAACQKLAATLSELVLARDTSRLVQEVLIDSFGPPDGQPITREMVGRAAEKLAEGFMARQYRTGSETDIKIPPDWFETGGG